MKFVKLSLGRLRVFLGRLRVVFGRLRVVSSKRTIILLVILKMMVMVYILNLKTCAYMHDSRWNVSLWRVLMDQSGTYRTVTLPTQGLNLTKCDVIPPGLQGRLVINTTILDWASIEKLNPNVTIGGRYKPPDCESRSRLAIIIPYRDRENHLKVLLRHLHPILQRQQINYRIYVVEMPHGVHFNKGYLMNIAYTEALKQSDYQCFIFHDVDLLPEDDRILYTCPKVPRHMSTAVDKYEYKMPYYQLIGGVVAMPTKHFKQVNGYSNSFIGWGGEDDDFYERIVQSNLIPIRYNGEFARYKMQQHRKSPRNPRRWDMLKKAEEQRAVDGLSTLKYSRIKIEEKPLYTWIFVTTSMAEQFRSMNGTIDGSGYQWNIINGTKEPPIVNWIPQDFKGRLPDSLAKI